MSKTRLRLITIISFAALLVLTLGLAAGILPARLAADAADPVNYQPSSIFSAVNNARVGSTRPEENASDEETYWVEFTLTGDDDNVSFRRDLALKWYEAAPKAAEPEAGHAEPGEGTPANPGVAKYFTMKFAFPAINFESFDVVFQSAEENITKDGQTTNTLHFVYQDSKLSVSVRDAYFDEEEDADSETFTALDYTAGSDIAVSLSEVGGKENEGSFSVALKVGDVAYGEDGVIGVFKNIGGYFLEYRSSGSSTPQTPMMFKAALPKSASPEPQRVLMKELNGQTFEVGEKGVADNAYPVLVLSETVYPFRLGQRFSLSYEAMDVCRDSITPTRSYYMLTTDKDGNYKKPVETASDYKSLSTTTFFMPTSDTETDEKAFVSIRFLLNDSTHSNYYVYLTWYAAESAVTTLGNEDYEARYICSKCGKEYTGEEYAMLSDGDSCSGAVGNSPCTGTKADIGLVESNYFDYIIVNREAEGPGYIGVDTVEAEGNEPAKNVASDDAIAAAEAYQTAVDEAAAKVSAGDGAYIYLPSMQSLISSDYADYRNLRFSFYYYKPGAAAGSSATSATSLRYNNLRLEVDEVGDYRFRVIAQDASGNAMKYYDEDGQLVTLTSSNVWDIEGIPEFTFYVDYTGPSIEDAGTQEDGYRDRSYSIDPFDIIALDGYKTEYTLYYFNEDELPLDENGKLPTGEDVPALSQLVDDLDSWIEKFEGWDAEKDENKPKILRTIGKYNSEVTDEDSDAWAKTDNDFAWDPDSSLSFVPQYTGIYFVKVDVTDAYLVNTTTSAYQAIYIGNPMDTRTEPVRWLENNITAVVLFSISAVLFVVIIVLFVVKPSDKTVEEVDLGKLKGKKSKKKE